MLPLCRAIVVVLDQFEEDTEEEADGSISVDKASLRQTILMVSTGDDSGLSAPISLRVSKTKPHLSPEVMSRQFLRSKWSESLLQQQSSLSPI